MSWEVCIIDVAGGGNGAVAKSLQGFGADLPRLQQECGRLATRQAGRLAAGLKRGHRKVVAAML